MSNVMATTENATTENAAGGIRKLACRYCQNTYSKAEHLTVRYVLPFTKELY